MKFTNKQMSGKIIIDFSGGDGAWMYNARSEINRNNSTLIYAYFFNRTRKVFAEVAIDLGVFVDVGSIFYQCFTKLMTLRFARKLKSSHTISGVRKTDIFCTETPTFYWKFGGIKQIKKHTVCDQTTQLLVVIRSAVTDLLLVQQRVDATLAVSDLKRRA